ncbi:A/G-specific adenine glycosylase [Formicincola oecophyllae]|uniref:Adenine DNA glycosylase n=1 Tax=Formicincola oecophyllae TaxID=2558361 RepID=A0A4Y6U972_9PROT|nr:A/G-specific adenine glycosylase [Formicincola oecophyllae]QDH13560.1 A/G-specific adenine glycosylase [Formicincola oecophyllae]
MTLSLPSAQALLNWYGRHRRSMPWRAYGQLMAPYHVHVSEIMLQQTTVATVRPYYGRFLERFPTVTALAEAPLDAVLKNWEGLGYYRRARGLHKAAQAVLAHGGYPTTVAGLAQLPGIGAYTSRAIASLAFGVPTIPVDGNVERIMARLYAVSTPLPAARRELASLAARFEQDKTVQAHPSDFTQALFDLGATLCTPRQPACALCPWRDACHARQEGVAEMLPKRTPPKARPVRYGMAFLVENGQGYVLMRRRPEKGILGGFHELPSSAWVEACPNLEQALPQAGLEQLALQPWQLAGQIKHVFTHLELHLTIQKLPGPLLERSLPPQAGLAWTAPGEVPCSTLLRKCLKLASSS